MRDAEGVFVGEDRCRHWSGVARYQDVECCGGRTIKEAVLRCACRGLVKSAECGRHMCRKIDEGKAYNVSGGSGEI